MKILINKMEDDCGGFKLPAELNIDLPLLECPDFFPDLCEGKDALLENPEIVNNDISEGKRKRRKKKSLTGLSRKRREANARERRRVEELNQGFVHLKKALPLPNVDISKLEILRLAMKWIDHLGTMLKNYDEQKELLNIRQMETSRPEDLMHVAEGATPAKHACLYHEFPDLRNTLWEESIGFEGRPSDENEGCVHIRSNSNFKSLFV